MTQQQGSLSVDRMCALGQVSRAGYYRHWQAVAPRTAETALRDEVQRLALAQRHYGYRRIAILLRRAGWQVNRKRVLRLMREDNLLCLRKKAFVPATTDSRHSWRVYPNLAWRLQPTGVNQLWVADITYVRLAEGFVYLAVVLDAFSRRAIGSRDGGQWDSDVVEMFELPGLILFTFSRHLRKSRYFNAGDGRARAPVLPPPRDRSRNATP